ncbi:TetR/AcrR family transcriptional regulator C-terminal domain-containing protein [Gordonia polyisoprenivorans]|uniref:TetR/AcrR family transcriptional regulator C-terminal domain-containing protein n=1 Tax=Gordonia polyisoprenivorans TaxID=84595 RepID=UPI001AD79FF8|nr:TetR/AcrR family transcriptional regulator C-terminal domain-containing protein [Gordonia polyisoprenivorans]QTI67815.1 TetR/AcrR family transcriptional regulator C-terminal domain-containing protein [Gordonia polyisoprenivorans]
MARTPLSRDAIVDAAFEQLAETGLDGITARALAGRLGVRAGALYYHVRDMTELTDEMATRILRRLLDEPIPDEAAADWRELLRTSGHRIRTTLLSYRDGATLVSGTTLLDDEALRRLEEPVRVLVAAGMTSLDAQRALVAINALVTGYVIEEQHRHPVPGENRITAEARRARLDPDEQPLQYALSEEMATLPVDTFEWVLEALIAGIGVRVGL